MDRRHQAIKSKPFIGFWVIREVIKKNDPEHKNKSIYENEEELRVDLSRFTKELEKRRIKKQNN